MKNDLLISLNADTATVNPDAIKAFREGSETFVTAINSMVDYLEEPLKSEFLKIRDDINTVLSGLKPTDQAPAALQANDVLQQLLGVFSMAQSMMGHLKSFADGQKDKAAAALNAIPAEVEKAIAAKLEAGELVKKEDHEAALGTAVSTALNSAKTDWETGVKLVAERKTALAEAKLPVPADSLLSLNAEDWTAKEATAKDRIEKVAAFKLPEATVAKLAWEAADGEFAISLNCLTEAQASAKSAKKGAGQDPFITNTVPVNTSLNHATLGVV